VRRVIKLGGTSIASGDLVREAAAQMAVLNQAGEQVVVVVSAPGNETSDLIRSYNSVSPDPGDIQEYYSFILLGEEKSVHLMVAALKAVKVNAVGFVPRRKETWPIIADTDDFSPLAEAKINEERSIEVRSQRTASRFQRFILPLLRTGTVPVVAGFFVLSSQDQLVTLGRGGSDITAFIVGQFINADEVIIVTDVQGVLSADPRLAGDPVTIRELPVEDLEIIASGGARVMHPRALRYKTESVRARIVDYRSLSEIATTGTTILGASKSTIFKNDTNLSLITLVGADLSLKIGVLQSLSQRFAKSDIPISSVVANDKFVCFFVSSTFAEQAYQSLHEAVLEDPATFSSVTIRGDLGEVRLRSSHFIDTPGILSEITGTLSTQHINIVEVVTSLTDIYVYVGYQHLDQSYRLLENLIKGYEQ
jgi:aspartate kinase